MVDALHMRRPSVERQLARMLDPPVEMAGPMRLQVVEMWFDACEFYVQTAAARGLAAGEVVEEIQHLRELLIRELSELIAALPARHSMATVLRLNRQVDKGIAHAVVGYTDALVQSLFAQRGTPIPDPLPAEDDVLYRLGQFEAELPHLRDKRA